MKKLLLLALLLPVIAMAQENIFPLKDGKIEYQKTENSTQSKEALYKNAKTWIVKYYIDAKQIIKADDIETGTIILKAKMSASKILNSYLNYTLQIEVKDEKYRVTISDIIFEYDTLREPLEQLLAKQNARTEKKKAAGVAMMKELNEKFETILNDANNAMKAQNDF